MGNTQHLKGPVIPRGDTGLGFCLTCLAQAKQGGAAMDGQAPAFAITMAPTMVPIPGPQGQVIGIAAVAVPTCWEHLGPGEGQQQKRPLLVASGPVPR